MSWDKVGEDVGKGPFGLFKWIFVAALAFTVIGSVLYMITKPGKLAIERIAMKNSFQYKEGMAQRAAILEASITEIDIRLQSNPDNKQDLLNQKAILKAQLKAITINE